MSSPEPHDGLHGLAKALEQSLPNSAGRLIMLDSIPRVHPGDMATAATVLALAGYKPETHRVYLENPCQPDAPCELDGTPRAIKHFYRFYSFPRDGNLGSGEEPLPPDLAQALRDLEADGFRTSVVRADGHFVVTVAPVEMPPGLGGTKSEVMLLVPARYARAAIDNFYLPQEVKGSSPVFQERAGTIETHAGRPWRRVSWHLKDPWPAGGMSLRAYVEWVREGLRRVA